MSSAMACRAASLISCGRGEIRKTLRKIHGVVLHRQSRHFANHGFGELLRLRGKHAPRDVRHVGFRSGHGDLL